MTEEKREQFDSNTQRIVQNTLAFLENVELRGNQVQGFVECVGLLQQINAGQITLQISEVKPEKPNGDNSI